MRKQCALWAGLAALMLGSQAGAQPREGMTTLVVYAKATGKLSARLRAVQLSDGTAVGKVTGNGAVIEVAKATAGAVEAKLRAAGFRVVQEKPADKKPVEELVLSYKKAPAAAELDKMGLKLIDAHQHKDGVVLLVRVVKALDAALVSRLEKEAHLTHAETNVTMRVPEPQPLKPAAPAKAVASPNDPLLPRLYGMRNIHAPAAWKKVHDSKVIVAVIDTGVDLQHEDLKGRLVPGINALDAKQSAQDDHGHGTHCAGIIGAIGNNKKGVVGVCWRVRIMPCKFLDKNGDGSSFGAIKCIDFARTHGAKIMSNSWGGGSFSQALKDAIGRAKGAGILFVAAAGNGGTNNDVTPFYPASYLQPNILVVAAIDSADKKAAFSQFGKKRVHMAAPGVDIFSTVPRSGKLGDSSGYRSLSGTSMAAPHVAGAAALALGHPMYDRLGGQGLKALLKQHVRKIPSMSGKCITGGTLDIAFLAR